MVIHDFSREHSIINQFIAELRDVEIQKDQLRFRKNIERIGEVLSYEMSKTLSFGTHIVQTPLGKKTMHLPINPLVICGILRAGLPLHQGVLNYFDKAENAFISAYRNHEDGHDDFDVVVNYFAAPNLTDKTLILCDPMLATGKTIENVLAALKNHGTPSQIHMIAVIGSKKGLTHIEKVLPKNSHLWIAAVDDDLNEKGYIIPGLGDAGDLSYGIKL